MSWFQETIDDDMHDRSSVKMVKIDDDDEANEYGLTERPALVFFEHQVPNIFEGDLTDHEQGDQLCLKNCKLGIFWQFLRIYLVFKQLWQFLLKMGEYCKNNLAIWSHCWKWTSWSGINNVKEIGLVDNEWSFLSKYKTIMNWE